MRSRRPRVVARALVAAFCVLAAATAATLRAQDQGGEAEDPNKEMSNLLDQLAKRAELYRKYALKFNCTESVIRSYYDPERGEFKRRNRELYDYIFTESAKDGSLEEDRVLFEENGKPVRHSSRDLQLEIPPAYAWSQIFSQKNRGRFLFRPAGKVLRGYRLLIQLEFVGSAAEPGGADIAGWSGRVSVDSTTLNLYTIEAEPSGQAARLEAEALKYQRAFAIMGVPLASKPRSRSLQVTFGLDHEGLTYPTDSSLEKFVYVRSGEQGREEKTSLRYRDYRFFKVGTKEEEARDQPSGTQKQPSEPPPDPRPPDPVPRPGRS